jgi:hypothetical protein
MGPPMPTEYIFDLTGDDKTLKLKLTKDLPYSHWDALDGEECLDTPNGNIDDNVAGKLICHNGIGEAVMTLNGASWSSSVNDTDDAVCDGCVSQCPRDWTWILRSKT